MIVASAHIASTASATIAVVAMVRSAYTDANTNCTNAITVGNPIAIPTHTNTYDSCDNITNASPHHMLRILRQRRIRMCVICTVTLRASGPRELLPRMSRLRTMLLIVRLKQVRRIRTVCRLRLMHQLLLRHRRRRLPRPHPRPL